MLSIRGTSLTSEMVAANVVSARPYTGNIVEARNPYGSKATWNCRIVSSWMGSAPQSATRQKERSISSNARRLAKRAHTWNAEFGAGDNVPLKRVIKRSQHMGLRTKFIGSVAMRGHCQKSA